MGVLNVTPDSFSDGGLHYEAAAAIEAGLRMAAEGADWIDVGGESTRPGAEVVPIEEEIRRVASVIEALSLKERNVSVDTRKPQVAEAALGVGAKMVNDISGLRDPDMLSICARAGCQVAIMHMQGEPETMQLNPHYEDVVAEVRDYLVAQARRAEAAGVARDNIWIDPGIGFGKNVGHNLLLLRHLNVLVETGYRVLVGASRKSFIGRVLSASSGPLPASERTEGTLAVHVLAQQAGAAMLRAHDVLAARRAIDMAAAVLEAE